MDLQTTRNLEKFLEMAELPSVQIEPKLCFCEGSFTLFMEHYQDRLLLTTAYKEESGGGRVARLLPVLLQRWSPERFDGVVQRVFVLNDAVMLSCAPPMDSQAEVWYHLYQLQRRLLLGAVQATL